MTLPGFTAEASLRTPSGYYQTFGTPEYQAHTTVSLAQLGFTPRPDLWPPGGIDLPSNWRDFEVAGATEVLCDERCRARCIQGIQEYCRRYEPESYALCVEEVRHRCTFKCCEPLRSRYPV
jgi:hypothetical protein